MLKQLVEEIYLEIVIANNHYFDIQEISFFPLSTLPDHHNKVPLILQLLKNPSFKCGSQLLFTGMNYDFDTCHTKSCASKL
jgi:hypothetical protein